MSTKLHDEMVQTLNMTESTKHPCFIQSSSKPILGANMEKGKKKIDSLSFLAGSHWYSYSKYALVDLGKTHFNN